MGKSSSQVVGYWYHPAFHMGLGYGPGDALLEIRCGDKTAWSGELTASGTITINKPGLFGGEKDQGGIQGDMDVMFGEPTQQPNAYLTQTFGPQQPAWRGFMTAVWKGGKYGAMNPYPQKISYKWRKITKGWDGDACWYPEKAAVAIEASTTLAPDADGWDYQILPQQQTPGFQDLAIPTDGWLSDGQTPFGGGSLAGQANTDWPVHKVLWVKRTVTIAAAQYQTLRVTAENGCVIFVNGAIIGAISRNNVDIDNNQQYAFEFPIAAGQTFELVIKAFDEYDPTEGQGGGTLLTVQILSSGLVGMNPAHILYYARTQQHMGREPTANMSDASFKAAADWYDAQGFGLCTTYDASQESIDAFIARVEKVAGCSMTRSPADGLWYLDIANGAYILADLPVLTDDDILAFTMQPATLDSAVNSVSVQFFDPQQKTTVSTRAVEALALVSAYGRSHQDTSYPEIPTSGLALRVAQRDLQTTATPTHGFEITATRVAHAWRKGTYFRLQAPKHGVADMVCIVGDPDSGTLASGAIKFTAVEDIYSLPASSFAEQEPGVDPRPSQLPLSIMDQVAFEAPYIAVVRKLSRADLDALPPDAGYLQTVAKDPASSRDYTIAVSTDGGSTYAGNSNGPWCPSALIMEGDDLSAAPKQTFTLADGTQLASVQVGSGALWDGEVVRVDALDVTTMPNTLTLGRGCADTVPQTHAANSRIWFFDGFTGTDSVEYTDGESIDVELLTNTGTAQLAPYDALPMPLAFASRQARPYPPVQLTINGQWWYAPPASITDAIIFSWATRNRVTQADQLLASNQAGVAAETGTTFKLDIYLNGVLDSSYAGLTAPPVSYSASASGTVYAVLSAQRAGLTSWQSMQCAPFAYAAIVITVTGDAPDSATGADYSYTYAVSGGTGPYTWSVIAGALPPGLSLDPATGELHGTPADGGSYTWTVRALDSLGHVGKLDDGATIAVSLALLGTYADGIIGVPYSSDLTIVGGATPYSNPRTTAGALPSGLALSVVGSKLRLSGTATGSPAAFDFTVAVDSADSETATSAQSMQIAAQAYAVWDAAKTPSYITRTSDTLVTCNATSSYYSTCAATIGRSSGKWMFQTNGSNADYFVGIAASGGAQVPWQNTYHLGYGTYTSCPNIGFENYNGQIWWNYDASHGGQTSTGGHVAANAWLTVAVDLDNHTISVFDGDTLLNSFAIPALLQGLTYFPACSLLVSGDTCQINAGQTAIAIPAPLAGQGYNPYWQ
jgi:hypothetical protein